MLEEICDELCRKLGGEAGNESGFARLRQGAEALAELACDLQISTIHSLAASILQRHPLESGIPVNARFAEENEDDYGDLDDQLIRHWWQTEALSDPALEQCLEKLLSKVSPYQIRDWFKKIYQDPDLIHPIEAWSPPAAAETDLALGACLELGQALKTNAGKKIAAPVKKFSDEQQALRFQSCRTMQQRSLERLARDLAAGDHILGSVAHGGIARFDRSGRLIFFAPVEHHRDQAFGFHL